MATSRSTKAQAKAKTARRQRPGRAAVERAGRGRNPVVRKRGGGRGNGQATPLTISQWWPLAATGPRIVLS